MGLGIGRLRSGTITWGRVRLDRTRPRKAEISQIATALTISAIQRLSSIKSQIQEK